jgi:hypothetical protein
MQHELDDDQLRIYKPFWTDRENFPKEKTRHHYSGPKAETVKLMKFVETADKPHWKVGEKTSPEEEVWRLQH